MIQAQLIYSCSNLPQENCFVGYAALISQSYIEHFHCKWYNLGEDDQSSYEPKRENSCSNPLKKKITVISYKYKICICNREGR